MSPPTPDAQRSTRNPPATRVVVVGGGLAGVAATLRLREAGCEVVLLERGEALGGRAAGDEIDGFAFDGRLPFVSLRDSALLRLIHDLGLANALLPLRPVQLAQWSGGASHAIEPSSLRGVARIRGVRPLHAARLIRLPRLMQRYRGQLDPAAPERAESLDYRSVADFSRLYFGSSVFERWIAPAITSTTLGDEHQLSRVAFLLQYAELGESREPWAIPRGGLFEIAHAAAQRLRPRLGVAVEEIEALASGGFAVHCAFSSRPSNGLSGTDGVASGETFEADAVVVATSASQAGQIASPLLTAAERDFFAGVAYGPVITLVAALDGALAGLPQLVRVPHVEGSPIECHLIEPGSAEGRAPLGRGLLTAAATQAFAKAHANAGDDVVEKELAVAIDALAPRAGSLMRLTRLDRRPAGVPRFEVGAYRALGRMARVQQDRRAHGRRLYFAGDYLIGPRTQHSVVSGERAAETLLADL